MKIRFYHWWVYWLYVWLWTPILASRPETVRAIIQYMQSWLDRQEEQNEL